MAQSNNIIGVKELQERRQERVDAPVESLVRLESPPDTLKLTYSLQTTLDLEEMLALFMQEALQYVEIASTGFRSARQGVVAQVGEQARHSADYGLQLHKKPLGELRFSSQHPFSEQDLAMLEHLMVPLLYPLRNGLKYHEALSTAYRDPLTGLHNRAALEEALPREVELAQRHDISLSMMIVDLDHFKRINDRYGHATGDCVLRTAATVMQKALRNPDQLYRFGGEEFVGMLPATGLDGAVIVAERVRKALESHDCDCDQHCTNITASIGVAQLEDEDNQQKLFDKADKAVYRAKSLGRNRVVPHQE